jgi:hypothetical protein
LTENIPFGSHFIERRLNQNGSVAAFPLFCFLSSADGWPRPVWNSARVITAVQSWGPTLRRCRTLQLFVDCLYERLFDGGHFSDANNRESHQLVYRSINLVKECGWNMQICWHSEQARKQRDSFIASVGNRMNGLKGQSYVKSQAMQIGLTGRDRTLQGCKAAINEPSRNDKLPSTEPVGGGCSNISPRQNVGRFLSDWRQFHLFNASSCWSARMVLPAGSVYLRNPQNWIEFEFF